MSTWKSWLNWAGNVSQVKRFMNDI